MVLTGVGVATAVQNKDVEALTQKEVAAEVHEATSTTTAAVGNGQAEAVSSKTTATTKVRHSLIMVDVVMVVFLEAVECKKATNHRAATLRLTRHSQAVVQIQPTKEERNTTMSLFPSTRDSLAPTEPYCPIKFDELS